MKIIGVDNLNREHIADVLWQDGFTNVGNVVPILERVCERLNRNLGDGPGTFYKVVGDDYRPSRGMEDLV